MFSIKKIKKYSEELLKIGDDSKRREKADSHEGQSQLQFAV